MDFKKTIKYDEKIKGLHIVDGELVNLDGEIIDIIGILEKVYGEKPFDLSTTTKTEESIDPDQLDEDSE